MATNLTWVQNRKSLKIWLEKNSTFIILERHQIKQKKREKLSSKITKKNGYTRRATLNNIFVYGKEGGVKRPKSKEYTCFEL